jgi:hypothetical protein
VGVEERQSSCEAASLARRGCRGCRGVAHVSICTFCNSIAGKVSTGMGCEGACPCLGVDGAYSEVGCCAAPLHVSMPIPLRACETLRK